MLLTPQRESSYFTCHVDRFSPNLGQDCVTIPSWVQRRLHKNQGREDFSIEVSMPLAQQEVSIAKLIYIDCCTTITSSKILNEASVIKALLKYRVLYCNSEVDLWIDGVVYRFRV